MTGLTVGQMGPSAGRCDRTIIGQAVKAVRLKTQDCHLYSDQYIKCETTEPPPRPCRPVQPIAVRTWGMDLIIQLRSGLGERPYQMSGASPSIAGFITATRSVAVVTDAPTVTT